MSAAARSRSAVKGIFSDLAALVQAHRHSREGWSPKDAMLGQDRRLFHRVALRAACRMNSRLFGLESSATAINLSLGGASLTADVSWPEGSDVVFRIEEMAFEADGIICFRVESEKKFRYGIKFKKMGLRSLLRLRRVLRDRYKGPLAIR